MPAVAAGLAAGRCAETGAALPMAGFVAALTGALVWLFAVDFTGVLAALAGALLAAEGRAAALVAGDFATFVAARAPRPVTAGWALPLARATEAGRVPAAADLPEVAVLVAGAFTSCLL